MGRRRLYSLAALLLVLSFSACTKGVTPAAAVVSASPSPAGTSAAPTALAAQVAILDPVLEKAIRFAVSKPSGTLTDDDLNSIRALSYFGLDSISSLNGIERLANLQKLDIENAALADITPLAGLKNLTSLTLKGNLIGDVSPLRGLVRLQTLDLSRNRVQNVEPLSALALLTSLKLDSNQIADASPLKTLTALRQLSLANNQLRDISALGSLKSLQDIFLSGNYGIQGFGALSALENIEQISADFMDKQDAAVLKSYPKLRSANVFGYIVCADPKHPAVPLDFSKVDAMLDAADAVLASVIKPNMSDYDKEYALFTYVQDHVHYGYVVDWQHTYYSAYGGLVRLDCECMGFAYTMDLLLNKAGVRCMSVDNTAHWWNIVQLDDGWYQVDASRCVTQQSPYKFFNMNDEMAHKLENWDSRYYPACDGSKYLYKNK